MTSATGGQWGEWWELTDLVPPDLAWWRRECFDRAYAHAVHYGWRTEPMQFIYKPRLNDGIHDSEQVGIVGYKFRYAEAPA